MVRPKMYPTILSKIVKRCITVYTGRLYWVIAQRFIAGALHKHDRDGSNAGQGETPQRAIYGQDIKAVHHLSLNPQDSDLRKA